MSASTNFILRDIANELEKIRIILERAYPPAPGCRTVPNNSTVAEDWQEGMNSNERDKDEE